jgi:hypothetical protein
MELLLNLFWLTLTLPALWLWRRGSVFAQGRRRFDRMRSCLLLSCVLMLLFPVVSATDDLHALGQEMEESSSSKRLVKPAASDKSSTGLNNGGVLPAIVSSASSTPSDEACGQVSVEFVLLLETAQFNQRTARAPPLSSLDESMGFVA